MSGIGGLIYLDGKPVHSKELKGLASQLERRGPEGTHTWIHGSVGLVHTRLVTTPEAQNERLPLTHRGSGCTITADLRIDNRRELIECLRLNDRGRELGDAEILLSAYLAWGENCIERIEGDFAFAIWDERKRRLFCARDRFGLKPFVYLHTPGKHFALASDVNSVLGLTLVPSQLNEARVADVVVEELEAIDLSSTFFVGIHRLPPAHALIVGKTSFKIFRYWQLEPSESPNLKSSEEYAEAFYEIFESATRCRLRSAGRCGAMLSGGLDSSSIVSAASRILREAGESPLATFSAVGPDARACRETQFIHAALTMAGLDPHFVNYSDLGSLLPELAQGAATLDDPFDSPMGLARAIYLSASRQGIKVVLDGVAGDIVLSEGSFVAQLVKQGLWKRAWREVKAMNDFWNGGYPPVREMFRGFRAAYVPTSVKNAFRPLVRRHRTARQLKEVLKRTGLSPDFAERVDLGGRLATFNANSAVAGARGPAEERCALIQHPNLTVARERYDRIASSFAVEPRDPFLDRRLVAFCVSLPGEQLLADGWPKVILRRAMKGRLPHAVCWRHGKDSLGALFNESLSKEISSLPGERASTDQAMSLLEAYLSKSRVDRLRSLGGSGEDGYDRILLDLGRWLARQTPEPGARLSRHARS